MCYAWYIINWKFNLIGCITYFSCEGGTFLIYIYTTCLHGELYVLLIPEQSFTKSID